MDGSPVTLDFSTFQPAQQSSGVSLDMSSFQPLSGQPAQPQLDLSNPRGEGLYQMQHGGKTVGVPYSQVQLAAQKGYTWADDQSKWQYAKDQAADPARVGGTSLTPTQSSYHSINEAEQGPAPVQLAAGAAKGALTLAQPITHAIEATTGKDIVTPEISEAHNGLQEVGKGGAILAGSAPALVAPVAALTSLGTGAASGLVGNVIGQHLQDAGIINDKQAALLTDLFSLAGGAAGGVGASRIHGGVGGGAAAAKAPSGTSSLDNIVTDTLGRIRGGAPASEAAATAATPAAEAAAKSGLSEGEAAQTVAPEVDVQSPLHTGIRDVAANIANDAGVGEIQPGSVRDAFGSVARGVHASAKADYAALDEASGGRWQRYDDAIQNVDRKMSDVAGIDDDAYDALQLRKNEIQTLQAQLVEDMKAKGEIDPSIADRAAAQYRRAMALQDVSNAVKASTKPTVVDGQVQEVVDPNGLANRLAKLNDAPLTGGSSRLVQALDTDNADALLGHVNSAQVNKAQVTNWKPTTATGQKALAALLERNSGKGVIEAVRQPLGLQPKVSFVRSLMEFNRMSPEEQTAQFGGEAPQARQFLMSQARRELLTNLGKGIGIYAIAHESGLSQRVLHMLLQ